MNFILLCGKFKSAHGVNLNSILIIRKFKFTNGVAKWVDTQTLRLLDECARLLASNQKINRYSISSQCVSSH